MKCPFCPEYEFTLDDQVDFVSHCKNHHLGSCMDPHVASTIIGLALRVAAHQAAMQEMLLRIEELERQATR